MQRKGNSIRSESQVKNQISVGIDMGGSLWATAVQDWEAGKMSYYGLKDKVDQSKEDRVFELVAKLLQRGKRVDVFYEAGRYGYWPARKLIALGANVHILPINKLKVIMSGKTIKTDKLDAKFLAGLHPSDLTIRKSFGFRTLKIAKVCLYHQLGELPEPDFAHKFW